MDAMEAGSLVHQALVLLAAAVVAVPVFHRLRLSPVLGYLVAGVAVGPHALGLITGVQDIARLGELGVVFLLFAIGLELKLSRFLVMRRLVFGLGGAQVVATALVLAGLVLAAGEAWSVALVVGAGLALSSSAVALQILTERGDLARSYGRVAFAVLLMQDLAVVPLLILVSALAGDGGSASSVLLGATARAVLAVAAVLAMGR